MMNIGPTLIPPYPLIFEELVRRALTEDLGRAGDLTTNAIVPADAKATAEIVAREAGRIAGIDIAACTFRLLDPLMQIDIRIGDCKDVASGDQIAIIRGSASAILSAERTALNFLSRLCGVATATRNIVGAIEGFPTQVVCTRKTIPGLRALEKYAVRAGGGANHRFGIDDAVLIKDNHRLIAGSVAEAIRRVRRYVGHTVKVEVEADSLHEVEDALKEGVDAVLFDNMPVSILAEGVRMARGRATTEASGRITAATAASFAATGVDLLSIGWITHSAPALDVSLDLAASL
jgi:nicotinate-nucleotide pyrophosphorylase (carboxylating)